MVFALLQSWLPVFLWAGVIFRLSSIPHLTTGWGLWDLVLRKGAHMTEYAVLAFLLLRAFWRSWPLRPKKSTIAWCVGLAIFYAISDEIHQGHVPGRHASPVDVLIDAVGIALAAWLCRDKQVYSL